MKAGDDEELLWYFAISSMMNPTSMSLRGVKAIESQPAEIMDHKLYFFGSFGFAEALPSPGCTFHGVMHRLDHENMAKLDKIESAYLRTAAKAKRYESDELFDVFVYTREEGKERNLEVDKPPHERYMEILITGAQHFGVQQQHIENLKKIKTIPRPKPEEFDSFGCIPEGAKTMHRDELVECDGKDGRPLCFSVNGKVMRCTLDPESKDFQEKVDWYSRFPNSQLSDIILPKLLFDPKYGAPEKLEDCTREHTAYVEHMIASFRTKSEWEVIARLDRTWKDDECLHSSNDTHATASL